MTTFLWDASNYDDPITVRDGIDGYTHKIAEGHHFYTDMEYKTSLNNALSLGIPVLGAYFVNHPGTVDDQVDWFVQLLDQNTPWWRSHPCFVLQIDAEQFSYMPSAPTLAEIQAFGDRLVNVHKVDPAKILAYAPQWLYGNGLTGLRYRLWASAYGSNPAVHYPDAYPGDNSTRWQSYSGQSPLLLQYGSNTTIGNQTTCDANGYRGSLAQLMADLKGGMGFVQGDEDMTAILMHDPAGSLCLAWTTPDMGIVWQNISHPGTEGAWLAATGAPRAEVPNATSIYTEVGVAIQARATQFAAAVTKGIEDAGLTGGSGPATLVPHIHSLPTGETGSAEPTP